MTDRAETIVCEPVHNSETSTIVVSVSHRFDLGDADLLDESWAEEFDRRLAVWESESPIAAPMAEEQTA
ncbi:MAG: hypothetical protein JWP89_3019 [Schlesneria sp.]|nr:hypothetical protein [Schlesneria sp.]